MNSGCANMMHRFVQLSLPRQRLAATKSAILIVSAVSIHEYHSLRSTKAESNNQKKSSDDGSKGAFDISKQFEKASREGLDFLNKMILTEKSQEIKVEEEPKETSKLLNVSFDELRKTILGYGKPVETEDGESSSVGVKENDFFSMARDFARLTMGNEEAKEKAMQDIIIRARQTTGHGDFDESQQSFRDVLSALQKAHFSLEKSFHHIDISRLSPTSLFYYLEFQDEIKNPSWKRRMHRFHRGIDIGRISHLNDMLYLSNLSYADSVDEIAKGCSMAKEPLELLYCDIEGGPNQPAHFIAIKKKQSIWSLELQVVMVVRGTKTLTDIVTDCVLDAVDYRGGKAHSGILDGGRYLVQKHKDLLENLRKLSRKHSIHLTVVGHSLGAGAGTIAGIEFNDLDNINAEVVGFGCPALLSPNLSKSVERYVTTVIDDADVVPRMSGVTVANVLLDIMEYDWTPYARRDIEHALRELQTAYPFLLSESNRSSVMEMVDHMLETYAKPSIKDPTDARKKPELCPPGTCVHIYRDGSGVSGSIAPGSFFQEIDVTRRMVDDHLIPQGYELIFLELMRQYHGDHSFQFDDGIRRRSATTIDEHFE